FAVSRQDAERLVGEFFLATGTRPKYQRHVLGIPVEAPRPYSVQEEKEHYGSLLVNQLPAECVVSFKGLAGETQPYLARVPHVPDVALNREKVDILRRHCARTYCRPLAVIEREIRERWQQWGLAPPQ